MSISGVLTRPPPEKNIPGDFELQADYWELIGPSNVDLENLLNVVSPPLLDFPPFPLFIL